MRGKKKGLTIYDLAEELKVSPSTVSRALKDHHSIGEETRKAVKKLAKERGYRPNILASSLRTNQSNTIGVLVSWINRPFISSLIHGIEKAARESGRQVIICQSYDQTKLETDYLRTLYESRISALIVSLAMETKDYSHFDILAQHNIPVVFVDRIPTSNSGHKVQINNFTAGYEATEHLIQQGCRRIAHFRGELHQSIYVDRMQGYEAALKKNNLEVDQSLVYEAKSLSYDEGQRLAKLALDREDRPDGIFCANDAAAVSAIQYAKEKGLKVPEEIAIIGFNDDPICRIIDPPLSSVHHPAVAMGEVAIQQALAMLDGDILPETPSRITLDTHVVVRASSDRKGKV